MDDLARSGRVLLTPRLRIALAFLLAFLGACSPAVKRTPVGVSTGGTDHTVAEVAPPDAPPLAAVPEDFRARWSKAASRLRSEHGRFLADVYGDPGSCADALRGHVLPETCVFVEDLFIGDAGAGMYLLARGDGGSRFAVGDARGRTLADDARDAGTIALDACARCHQEAPRAGVFSVP